MLPAARLKAVIDLLELTGSARIPMDATVGDYMRNRRYIGSKDRAEIVERLYTMTRHHSRIGWWLMHLGLPDTGRNRTLVFLSLQERKSSQVITGLFDGSKFSASPLDTDELAILDRLETEKYEHPEMPVDTRMECPPGYADVLHQLYGTEFEREMAAMQIPAPLDLRVNLIHGNRTEVEKSLRADGIQTNPTPFSPWGLRVQGKVYLSETKSFRNGDIEIQDEGSQLIALTCGAKPGMQVLDYCAGAGGKTLALASAMSLEGRPKGRIVAMDIEASRLEKARQRFRRAGAHDIIEVRPLSDERHRKWLKRQKQTFDVVLADVPCSGTGTWRRNPDMRWRHFGPALEDLIRTQSEILERVCMAVKPGGRLVYATCSLLPQENEEQIEVFLKNHPDFSLVPFESIWNSPETLPTGCQRFMRLSPGRHNTDGFFAAALTRT